MTGLEYEKLAAKYLRRHGFTGVEVTKGSGDYGVDVIAHKSGKKYAVQCKYYSGPVSLSAVQEAVAGKAMYKCDMAMVITNSTFTASAKKLAKANNVILLPKITSSGKGKKLPICMGVIIFLLLVGAIASGDFSVMCETVAKQFRDNISGIAVCNVVSILAAVAIIFSFVFAVLKGKKSKRNKKHLSPKAEENKAEENKAVKIEALPSVQHNIVKYADTVKLYNFLEENNYYVNFDSIDKLVSSETFSTTRIQMLLQCGYPKAARIVDLLLANEFVTETDGHLYKWSSKAK